MDRLPHHLNHNHRHPVSPSSPTPLIPAHTVPGRYNDETAPSSPLSEQGLPTTKVLRDSYQSSQSSRRSSKVISRLPAVDNSHHHFGLDPEKEAARLPERDRSAVEWTGGDVEDESEKVYEEDWADVNDKALRILIWLSAPCFLASLILLLWTFFALLLSLLLKPIYLVTSKKSMHSQLTDFLSAPLRFQLSMIRTFVPISPDIQYDLSSLLFVLCLSPVVSVGVAIWAWTAASFWFFAAVIGDPEGTHEEERRGATGRYLKGAGGEVNDGKESVLVVRKYWRKWLVRGLGGGR